MDQNNQAINQKLDVLMEKLKQFRPIEEHEELPEAAEEEGGGCYQALLSYYYIIAEKRKKRRVVNFECGVQAIEISSDVCEIKIRCNALRRSHWAPPQYNNMKLGAWQEAGQSNAQRF